MDLINKDKLITQFLEHKLWKETLGKEGKKLELDEIDFRNIDISKYPLDQSYITGGIFDGMNLCEKDLYSAVLCSSTFKSTRLEMADFSKADLSYVDFTGADIKRARFNRTDCIETIFVEADLTEALLVGAGFYLTDFRRAVLSNADVSRSTFEEVLISEANLHGIRGLSEAFIKSINIGTLENPIVLKDEEARQWLLKNSLTG